MWLFFCFKQKTAYEMRISDWSSDVCSSDLLAQQQQALTGLSEVTRLNRVRVAAGLDSRLDIIGADIRLLQAQQDEANLQAQAAIHAIQLLVAIGGGFDPAANVLETTSVPARTTP